jgi:glycosyltransferase involved in cell wall biosynthesis
MKTILAIRDTYRVSGPCRGILHLVEGAKSKGIQFIVGMFLTGTHLTSPAIEEFKRRGVHIAVWSQRRRYDFRLIYKAWKTVREHKAAILQSHGYKPAVLAWCLKCLTGLPWVAVVHGQTSENKRIAFYNKLDLWLTRSADRVVAVSAATGRFLEKNGIHKSRVRVIPNAIDPQAYQPWKDGTEFRQNCGASPNDFLIGIIGRLSPEKGGMVFLDALQRVIQTIPTTKAAFVGEGQEIERLQTTVYSSDLQDRVTFAGYQSDISAVYSALDLVVIPSYSEGLPNVLLEAFLHHKAVVATAVGGIPDVMQSELSKWLVPPGNAAALADAIIEALQLSELRTEAAEAGAKLVREMFLPARRVNQFLRVYEELVPPHVWQSWPKPNNSDENRRCGSLKEC